MENKDRDYYPGQWQSETVHVGRHGSKKVKSVKRGIPVSVFVSLICLVAVIAILFTYTLTAASERDYYNKKLIEQQEVIDTLEDALVNQRPSISVDSTAPYENLQVLAEVFRQYSYYAGDKTDEEIMTEVMKAYAYATGDLYAEYYTEDEYAQMIAENNGDSVGIGVSVIQTTVTVNGFEYQVFQIIAVFQNAPAEAAGVRVGDYIYAIKADGELQTVAALGGYTAAMTYMRGEKGSTAEFGILRDNGKGAYDVKEMSVVRDSFVSTSVDSFLSESNPKVGIVRISSFDMTTPGQFKEAVSSLKKQGAESFVFDLRNNPGGDLQSIKAVLTYFLRAGDLILSAIDKDGKLAKSYYAEPMTHAGDYAACNVAAHEVGMYRDLPMVVLCNENTASAAEVFTATLRDYGLATIVGETTFGKGIMQSYIPLSWFGDYEGYAKMTTYAYVTKCGVTYHDIGITPEVQVELSEEAKEYNFYVLPQSKDNQLAAAVAQLNP